MMIMMNNWLLLLFFLLIPQFLIDILLPQLLLLVQLHNVRRIRRDTNKLFSSQVKKPVISQTGSKIANDHQIPQEVYHGRTLWQNPKQDLEVALSHNTLKKLGALGFGSGVWFWVFFRLTEAAMYLKENQTIEVGSSLYWHNWLRCNWVW